MSVTNLLIPCPDLQGALDENFLTCSSSELAEAMPHLQFLTSPDNNFGLKQRVSPGGGKVRRIELLFKQRLLESEISENVQNPKCTSTTKRGVESVFYDMDTTENVGVDEYYEISDWERLCESGDSFVASELRRMMNGVRRKIAKKSAEEIVADLGGWNSTTDDLSGDILQIDTTKTGGDIYPFGMQNLDIAFMQAMYCAPKGVFGGTKFFKYYGQMLAGCCANMGVDLGKIMAQFGIAIAYDKWVAQAAGGNEFSIVSQLGASTLLTWTQNSVYDGANLIARGLNYYPTVIYDEFGIPYDLNIKNDCGQIAMQVVATTKAVTLPTTLFQSGDENFGVNFNAMIEATVAS
jgi:hypothetical protein